MSEPEIDNVEIITKNNIKLSMQLLIHVIKCEKSLYRIENDAIFLGCASVIHVQRQPNIVLFF